MLCEALLDQAIVLPQRRGRVTSRARTRQCTLPTLRAYFLLCALLTLLLAPSSPPLHAQPLVLLHATVIDTTGAPAKSDMTVVMTGSQISALGETGNVRVPPDRKSTRLNSSH